MRLLALLLLLFATPGLSPAAAQEFPKLTGRVVDAANILPPDVEARIEQRSAAIEKQTSAQVVVATVPSLQGYEIEDYGYRLGRAWGIGQKRGSEVSGGAGTGDNGVILLVAPNDRKVRIEVGYGLEPVLTDALSAVIIQRAIIPEFRAGNMPAGVEAGFDAIARQVELPADQAVANVQQAEAAAAGASTGGISFGTLIFLLFLFLWIWMAIRRSRGGRRARRGGPIVIWGPGTGGGWGGGGGGWGGGGGGFGGGGGGFGGGGASGGW
jgi:uncharacterized protein